jgi:ATP-dependent DNA helicase RecG
VNLDLADASDIPADSAIVEGYGLEALDADTINVWRNLFSVAEPGHPFLQGDALAMLRSIGGWRTDTLGGQDGPTLAGLLMFGRERAILDRLPWYQLDYREVDERRPELRWLDRVTLDGKWPGNVFSFFLRVEPKLAADLKVPFKLAANMQRIDATPAHEALREALVNTLIHADYTGTRGIRVVKGRRSFQFFNPGLLRVPWSVAVQGNASDPRNPSLQKMFQLVGFGDRAGSGVPKITLAWRDEGWPAPQVTENFDAQETSLVLDIGRLAGTDPVADRADPVSDPVADPTDPVADPTDPVADPTDPVADPTDPVADLTDPLADPTDPVTDPVADPNDPVTDPVAATRRRRLDRVGSVLEGLRGGPLAPSDLQEVLGLKHRPTFRTSYLRPALEAGLIEATLPDKPNSRLQRYRLTPAGIALLAARGKEGKP